MRQKYGKGEVRVKKLTENEQRKLARTVHRLSGQAENIERTLTELKRSINFLMIKLDMEEGASWQ